jgi:hypothetical protein
MIGPGSLPRPFGRFKKRTLAYTRPRKRRGKSRPPISPRVHHEIVIFDRRPAEFPIATLVPIDAHDRSLALAGGLRRWLAARWTWLRPRMVPVIASAIGTLLVIASANYLTHAHGAPIRGHVSCSISAR